MENIFEYVQNIRFHTNWIEAGAVTASVVYVVLAARQHVACWFFGVIGAALWSYAAFAVLKLYIDGFLQIFYVVIGLIGWYHWAQKSDNLPILRIHQLSHRWHLGVLWLGSLTALALAFWFDQYTAAVATYPDAFVTVFSVVATFMTARKVLENWLYWVAIDFVSIFLYVSREGYLFALLHVIYIVVAIFGYLKWRKTYRESIVSL